MSANYESLAKVFHDIEGRWPSRIDWRGDNLTHFRTSHGIDYPHEKTVYRQYGGWRHFLANLGVGTVVTQETAAIAEEYLTNKYGNRIQIMPGSSGTIDCYFDGARTEVKSSSLANDDKIHTPRFRFRLHSRQYSSLVDKMILVGIVKGEVVAEWLLDNVAIIENADNKSSLNVVAKYPFQGRNYPLFFYEVWKEDVSYLELIERLKNA